MASKLEQFNQQIKQTGLSVADLTKIVSSADAAFSELDAKLIKSTEAAKAMTERQAELNARLKELKNQSAAQPGTVPAYKVDPLTSQLDQLKTNIKAQQELQRTLLTQKQGVTNLTPDTQVLSALKAANTTYANMEALKVQRQAAVANGDQGVADVLTEKIDNQRKAYSMAEAKVTSYIATLAKFQQAEEAAAQATADANAQLAGTANQPQVTTPTGPKLTSAQIEEQKRLEQLQSVYEKDLYDQEKAYSQQIGKQQNVDFGPSSVTGIHYGGPAGVQEIVHNAQDLEGINHTVKNFIDTAGNVLPNSSRQFNTFASSVARDTLELAKWTIAIGLIYGPLRKFQEIMTQMITNEAALASAMIVLTDSSVKVADVFTLVKDAANEVGDNVAGAIDVFTQAYRATGDLATSQERMSAASSLMSSAMLLAKLSGMQYNEAIDHLTGGLKQAGLGLDQGNVLLDKWVRTSQVANVDVSTLAVGFSVLGESADTAGLSFDQLNGLLAIISENMGTSGTEAANAARAIVSGFESTKAIKALDLLGISVNNTAGEMRPLLDIMTQISDMKTKGLINDTQFSQLTLAIGGGTRRQAVVAATIQDTDKINKVASQSANSAGAAQEALAKKLDTVQTATTRLGNAFQSLAQTLGDSGGLLDIFKFILELTNNLVKGIDALAGSIGKVAPLLATVGIAAGLFSIRPDIASSLIGGIKGIGNSINPNVASKNGVTLGLGDKIGFGLMKQPDGFSVANAERGATLGVLTSLIPAIMNFTQGNKVAGGGDLVGGLGGGIAAAFMGQSPIIGSVIGQAIAEAFIKAASVDSDATKYVQGKGTYYTPGKTASTNPEDVANGLTSILTGGESSQFSWKQLLATTESKIKGLWAWEMRPGDIFNRTGSRGATYAPTVQEQLYMNASPEQQAEFDRQKNLLITQGKIAGPTGMASYSQQQQYNQQQTATGYAPSFRKNMENTLQDQLNLGKINPTEYSTRMDQIKNFETVAAGWEITLGEQYRKVDTSLKTATDDYGRFVNIMTYGSSDQIDAINNVTTSISDLQNLLDALGKMNPSEMTSYIENGITIPINVKDYIARLTTQKNNLTTYGGNLLKGIAGSAGRSANPYPTLFAGGTEYKGDFGSVVTKAQQYENEIMKANDFTDSAIKDYRNGLDDMTVAIEEGGKLVFKKMSEFGEGLAGSDALQKAIDDAVASGKLEIIAKTEEPGFNKVNLPQSMESQLQAWAAYYSSMLQSYGIADPSTPQVVMWEGGQWSSMTAGTKGLQMAQDKLIELTQKQLDQGMWNLPEGATFWVPINSLTAANKAQGGAGMPPASVDNNTNAITANTVALDKLTGVLSTPLMSNIPGAPTGFQTPQNSPYWNPSATATQYSTDHRKGRGTIYTSDDRNKNTYSGDYNFYNPYNPSTIPGINNNPSLIGPQKPKVQSPSIKDTWDYWTSGNFWEKFYHTIFPNPNTIRVSPGSGDAGLGINGQATKISMNLNTTTTLMIDGRVLATILKPYIKEFMAGDLGKTNTAYGGNSGAI